MANKDQLLALKNINQILQNISNKHANLLILYNFLNKTCNHYNINELAEIRVLTLIFFKKKVLLNDFILGCLGYSGNYFKKRQNVLKLMKKHTDITFSNVNIYNRSYFLLSSKHLIVLCKHLRNRKSKDKKKIFEKLYFCKKLSEKYKSFVKTFNKYNFINFYNHTHSKLISKNICDYFLYLTNLSNDSNLDNLKVYEYLLINFNNLMNQKLFANLHLLAEVSLNSDLFSSSSDLFSSSE